MKILISAGFGAGWSTWMRDNGKDAQFLAMTYAPIINAIEAGTFTFKDDDPLVTQFRIDFAKVAVPQYADDDLDPYVGGCKDLCVVEVEPETYFRVDEYDGRESVERLNLDYWFLSPDADIEGEASEIIELNP